MNKPPTTTQTTFGFISVRSIEGLGHCGGLLIVSQIGRPIEFHCSAPVATNRAQKILYGQTYETYLHCEQIGLALIDKAKTQPQLIVANSVPLMGLNELLNVPVVLLDAETSCESPDRSAAFCRTNNWQSFEVNQQSLWASTNEPQQLKLIQTLTASFTRSLSLDEPFERIEKAIEEAQAVAR